MRRRALLAALALACATPAAAQHVFLGPADAHALMQREPVTVLAAGQAPEQFARGHLAGARRVALGDIAVSRDGVPNELPPVERLEQVLERAGVDDARPVLVYGDPLAAARLWLTLDVLGHPRAYLLDGGLAGWEAAGLPL
ncbi:MAG TPA: rhodanese-like domain-containing protein, partial [Gemmatimonadales bacterium]|nr:rhodanese-like domain-containing protein [Gemmatimonadales bacterium]